MVRSAAISFILQALPVPQTQFVCFSRWQNRAKTLPWCEHEDWARVEKQNLQPASVLSNRGAVRSGQENMSLRELPSQTTPLGLSRRKVTSAVSAVTGMFPTRTWSVSVTTITLSPAQSCPEAMAPELCRTPAVPGHPVLWPAAG